MNGARRYLHRHRWAVALFVALAMLLKALVPTGYMIDASGGAITIELCSGYGPVKMVMAMPGMAHDRDMPDHVGKAMPCAFAGLAGLSLSAVDPVLLVAAVALLFATIFRIAVHGHVSSRQGYLRPPLRGPPSSS